MTDLMLRAPAPPVTPDSAGWRWLSYASGRVDGEASFETGGDEICLVNLGGQLSPASTAPATARRPRAAVRRAAASLYLPPHALHGRGRRLLARCGSRADADAAIPVQPIDPAAIRVEVRGAGNATRQINHIIPPEFAAHRLLVVEVLTPAGNWSSYPPHKHEQERLPVENDLEEVYAYRFGRPRRSGCSGSTPRRQP